MANFREMFTLGSVLPKGDKFVSHLPHNNLRNSMKKIKQQPIIALVGPTAIGKTNLSLQLARNCNCEIVGLDSMQVYRYMDIGTAKISTEEMDGIPHHLISIVDPDEDYDAAQFVRDANLAVTKIFAQDKVPLLTGGTGLYLKAFQEGLFTDIPADPGIRQELIARMTREGSEKLHEELFLYDQISARRIHKNDQSRIIRGLEIYLSSGVPWSEHIEKQKKEPRSCAYNIFLVGLTCPRPQLYARINQRSQMMIDAGLEDEVRGLLARGYGPELKAMNSIGYRHMLQYIAGAWNKEEMVECLARDTRRYAKRQYTWFTKTPGMQWFEVADAEMIIARCQQWLDETKELLS